MTFLGSSKWIFTQGTRQSVFPRDLVFCEEQHATGSSRAPTSYAARALQCSSLPTPPAGVLCICTIVSYNCHPTEIAPPPAVRLSA